PSRLAALKRLGLAAGFGEYLRSSVADGVHSGTGRTALSDDNTDYYPVPLKEQTLRPGTVYVDPYGHVLVLARRVSQTEDTSCRRRRSILCARSRRRSRPSKSR